MVVVPLLGGGDKQSIAIWIKEFDTLFLADGKALAVKRNRQHRAVTAQCGKAVGRLRGVEDVAARCLNFSDMLAGLAIDNTDRCGRGRVLHQDEAAICRCAQSAAIRQRLGMPCGVRNFLFQGQGFGVVDKDFFDSFATVELAVIRCRHIDFAAIWRQGGLGKHARRHHAFDLERTPVNHRQLAIDQMRQGHIGEIKPLRVGGG